MTYAKEQRIRFIDFLLFNYGYINRSMLMDYFGIGSAMATRDLTLYRSLAPANVAYNPSLKSYTKTNEFKRLYP